MASRRTAKPTTEVAITEPAGLPDLIATGSEDFQVDSRDIQPPRIKAASPISGAATAGNVPLFSLYAEKGADDEHPVVLVPPTKGTKFEAEKDGDDYGFLVYVLKIRTSLGASVNPLNWQEEQRQGGELRVWDVNDASAPPFAKRQYNLVVFAPESESDSDLPHNLLLRGARGASVGRRINTLLMQRMEQGQPLYTAAFRVMPARAERSVDGQTQRWAYPEMRQVQATTEDILAAQELYSLIKSEPQRQLASSSNGDGRVSEVEPAI